METLFVITAGITLKGLEIIITPLEIEKETKNSYKISNCANWKRIEKDKLLEIGSYTYESPWMLHYHTFCLEGDRQKAIELLKQHINQRVQDMKDQLNTIPTL